MTPESAYLALRSAGLRPFLDAGQLRLAPPPPDDMLALAREHKAALIAILSDRREAARLERLHAEQQEMEAFFRESTRCPPEVEFLATFIRMSDGTLVPSRATREAFGYGENGRCG